MNNLLISLLKKKIYKNIKENIKNTIEPSELPSIAELTTRSSSLERTTMPSTKEKLTTL